MAKYKPKVNFRGKKMNLLEATLYLCRLKAGIVNLNLDDYEQKDYQKWKNYKEEKNKRARELRVNEDVFKELNEKKYLIETLENKIKFTKLTKNIIYCEEHGHKEKEGSAYTPPGIWGAVIHYTCGRCGTIYKNKYDSYEEKNIDKPIDNPFRG